MFRFTPNPLQTMFHFTIKHVSFHVSLMFGFTAIHVSFHAISNGLFQIGFPGSSWLKQNHFSTRDFKQQNSLCDPGLVVM